LFNGYSEALIAKWDDSYAGQLEICVRVLEFWQEEGGGCLVRRQTELVGGRGCVLAGIGAIGLAGYHCTNVEFTIPNPAILPEIMACSSWFTENGIYSLTGCFYIGPGAEWEGKRA
jgi:hypothetical protein